MNTTRQHTQEAGLRTEVHFHTVDGLRLHGWLYLPNGRTDPIRPHPCVILSHGFSAIKTMGLAEYAESFTNRGLACLVYDHRNYGDSEGLPRHESDPWMQVRDMREAITFVADHEAIDAGRIGLWGTSYSGGHVLVVAALDNRVQCVVSQVPLVSGSQNLRHWIPESAWNKMQERFSEDRTKRAHGEAPKMITSSREGDETWQWQQAVDRWTSTNHGISSIGSPRGH
jgi:cephalosporin-C deacetylase-like acetyl esterase